MYVQVRRSSGVAPKIGTLVACYGSTFRMVVTNSSKKAVVKEESSSSSPVSVAGGSVTVDEVEGQSSPEQGVGAGWGITPAKTGTDRKRQKRQAIVSFLM
jgi:hypothetical protein